MSIPINRSILFPLTLVSLLFLFSTGCGNRSSVSGSVRETVDEIKQHIRTQDFGNALKLANQILDTENLDDETEAEALYLSGVSAWHNVPPSAEWESNARARLTRLVESHPGHPLAPQAAYTLGRIHEVRDYPGDETDREGADAWYVRCMEQWPDSAPALRARFRLAAAKMNRIEYPDLMREGTALLDAWLHENRPHELAPVAALFLAQQHDVVFQDPETAYPYYQMAEDLGWVSEHLVGHRRWRMAEIAESLGRVEEAVALYQDIIRENLRSSRGYMSQQRLLALREAHPDMKIKIPELSILPAETTP